MEWATESENDLHAFRMGLRDVKGKKHPQFGKYNVNKEIKRPTKQSGEGNNRAKLTEEDILKIRELAGSMLQSEIARIFGISQVMVSSIIRRQSWAHI